MSLNCVEIEEIIKTFPKKGIIKGFYQIDKNSFVINIFDGIKDFFINASVTEKYNRICLVPDNENFKKSNMRFEQVLNSNLIGGKIKNIFQYHYSRIIVFEIGIHNKINKLIFRLWGNGGNILFIEEDNTIIDCLKRMPKREEWPDENFKFPEKKEEQKHKFIINPEFSKDEINSSVFYYYTNIIINEELNKKKENFKKILDKEITNLKNQIDKIAINISVEREEQYKKYGELIKSNLYKMKKGEPFLEVEDYNTNEIISIPLLKNLSPSENATKYFEKYKKIKLGRIKWEIEKKKYQERFEKIEYYSNLLFTASDLNQLLIIEKEINKNYENKKNIKLDKYNNNFQVREFILADNYKAFVSKSAKDVDKILKYIANGNDYWFHIRDYPGSHVIVKEKKGLELSEEVKKEASNLAVYFSKGKTQSIADVHFTRVKYLHKPKGGPAGLVFPTQEKNITVKFEEKMLEKIFKRELINE